MTTGDQALFEARYPDYDQEAVIRFLTFDKAYANSILACLAAARENGRSIREIISSEMWEHLNNFYLELADNRSVTLALEEPHRFFKIIQMRSHLFTGLLDSTMRPWRGLELRPHRHDDGAGGQNFPHSGREVLHAAPPGGSGEYPGGQYPVDGRVEIRQCL